MKKVLIINASFRAEKGITDRLTNFFIEGMEQEGAIIDVFYLEKLKIKPCTGCQDCWLRNPGVCTVKNDEMLSLLKKMSDADYWVFAAPVYSCWGSSKYKNFLDRLHPIMEPYMEEFNGEYAHVKRPEYGNAEIILLSTAALTIEQFDPLISHINNLCTVLGRNFIGSILRPTSLPFLQSLKNKNSLKVEDIILAAKEAGKQLIVKGFISQDILNIISRDLIPKDEFIKVFNSSISKAINQIKKKRNT
jgi:multimeric flavodoxin WrbA